MRPLFAAILSGCSALGTTVGDGVNDLSSNEAIAARIPRLETGFESDHLTGDWGGLRTRLVDRGIHIYAGYTGEVLGNVSGGLRRGTVYEGLFELAIDVDTEKLKLWKHGLFHASSIYPHGSSVSSKYAGDLLTASNIDAFDSMRLYEFWYQQTFADGRFSLRLGQLLADEEFTFDGAAENFINSAFGWPAFISGNTVNTGPAFYVAAPGIRARFEPNPKWFLQTGLYDGDTFDSPEGDPHINASGLRVHVDEEQGFFWLSELGYNLNSADDSGLKGEYKAGFWLHTGEFESNFHDRNGDPFLVTGLDPGRRSYNLGAYLAGQQTVWRAEGNREVAVFGRIGGSPRDRSLFELAIDGGITAGGLVAGREEDQFGVGAAFGRLSRDIQRTERLDASLKLEGARGYSDHETVLEIFYSAQLTAWWTIQPDFQWIFNPGGNSAAPDAIVIGIRTSIVF